MGKEGAYYLEWREGSKRVRLSAGKDPADASARRLRKLAAYPPGAVIILPGNTPHFHWATSGEYVTQVTATGPLGLEYLSAKDDPRSI